MSSQRGIRRRDDARSDHPTTARVRALAAEGLPKCDIARHLGVTHQRVSQIVKKHGIKCILMKDGVRKAERIERMKAECAGMTAKQAATHLGTSRETIGNYKRESGFSGLVRAPNPRQGRFGKRTQRFIQAAPVLAERGLSKADAARELGLSPAVFAAFLHKRCPNIQWRDGREDGRGGRPLSPQTKRILESAPVLAKRGLTKSEAARELGVTPDAFKSAIYKRLPDVEWRNGRAPSSRLDG